MQNISVKFPTLNGGLYFGIDVDPDGNIPLERLLSVNSSVIGLCYIDANKNNIEYFNNNIE